MPEVTELVPEVIVESDNFALFVAVSAITAATTVLLVAAGRRVWSRFKNQQNEPVTTELTEPTEA